MPPSRGGGAQSQDDSLHPAHRYLGIIEQRVNEVLQLFFLRMKQKHQSEKPAVDELGRPISRQRADRMRLQTGPQVPHGSAKVAIEQVQWEQVTKRLAQDSGGAVSPVGHEERLHPIVEDMGTIRKITQEALTKPLSRPPSGRSDDMSRMMGEVIGHEELAS